MCCVLWVVFKGLVWGVGGAGVGGEGVAHRLQWVGPPLA
eukprot:COSAG05_NODE_19628_length_290_cov_0.523560_1_plen_39_part_00